MGRMKAKARRYFWWPLADKDIEELARQCCHCTQNDKQPVKAPLQQWNVPDGPWQHIHIDFMGKFMGYYYLIIVDAHSKWLEVFMMNNISTAATMKNLTSLFSRYGLCEEIVSDNGTQFTSDEFNNFCIRNGIRHIRRHLVIHNRMAKPNVMLILLNLLFGKDLMVEIIYQIY